MNVLQSESDFAADGLAGSATSIRLSTEGEVTVDSVYHALTREVFYNIHIALSYGYEKLKEQIEGSLGHMQHRVQVIDKGTNTQYTGVFTGFADDGKAMISGDDGTHLEILSGTVLEDFGVPEIVEALESA